MAVTIYGVNATGLAANPIQNSKPGEGSGTPFIMYDEVVLAADYGANDICVMGNPIPAGARILECIFTSPDNGGTATVNVGTATTSNSLINAADNSGQAVRAAISAGAADAFKKLTVSTQYQLKFSGASSGATGNKMSLMIKYVMY